MLSLDTRRSTQVFNSLPRLGGVMTRVSVAKHTHAAVRRLSRERQPPTGRGRVPSSNGSSDGDTSGSSSMGEGSSGCDGDDDDDADGDGPLLRRGLRDGVGAGEGGLRRLGRRDAAAEAMAVGVDEGVFLGMRLRAGLDADGEGAGSGLGERFGLGSAAVVSHFRASFAPSWAGSPGWLSMTVRSGTGLSGVQRQHGSPSSSPLERPSPSESIRHRAGVQRKPAAAKSRPNGLRGAPGTHCSWPRASHEMPEPRMMAAAPLGMRARNSGRASAAGGSASSRDRSGNSNGNRNSRMGGAAGGMVAIGGSGECG